MKSIYLSTALLLILLSGCASGPTPQTAQEYRQAVAKGGYGALSEVYEVKGPYAKVAATVKGKSSECLNRVVNIQQCRGPSCVSRNYTFIPRANAVANKTEIVVQVKVDPDNNVYLGGPPPKSGMYVAVADLVPVGSGKTKVSVYATDVGMFAHIPRAIKHWANGTNLGCPDLAAEV